MEFRRYAVFACPADEAFARAGATWLGWDSALQEELASPIGKHSKRARKYGFHGTLKAPFRLAEGMTEQGLVDGFETLAASVKAPRAFALTIAQIGGFLALVPEGDTPDLSELAGGIVRGLDRFRAPLNEAERTRRRNLTPAEKANVEAWGYPYVMDAFRYHMTLTGHLPEDVVGDIRQKAAAHFAEHITAPYALNDICLMGEAADSGRFHVIKRAALKEG